MAAWLDGYKNMAVPKDCWHERRECVVTESRYRISVVLLLLCQSYVAVKDVFLRPTVGSMRKASSWTRQALMDNVPLIEINGGEVEANVTNSSFDVDLSNQPIQVEIVH
jgi:hypothetical protein